MRNTKDDRLLEILYRGLRGEGISVRKMAEEYGVSVKSVTRTVNDIKAFLADRRDIFGNTELEYSYQDKCYYLKTDDFLTSKELFALLEVLIGTRGFSKIELLTITDKLKSFTTTDDRKKLAELVAKELYHYTEVKHDCDSVEDMLWQLSSCICERKEISVDYYRMDRTFVTYRIRPVAVTFSDFYFYLIAFKTDEKSDEAHYFRVDRIKNITVHRKRFNISEAPAYDEGLLKKRSLLMWPGKLRKIRFEFTGPSVQAVLDKLPTAKIISRDSGKYLIETEVYGDGIKMWLLSQGAWVKVTYPEEFALEMKAEIENMKKRYDS